MIFNFKREYNVLLEVSTLTIYIVVVVVVEVVSIGGALGWLLPRRRKNGAGHVPRLAQSRAAAMMQGRVSAPDAGGTVILVIFNENTRNYTKNVSKFIKT